MPTIRDPQTDVSIADYIIDGDWSYIKKLTYTSTLSFSNDNDIVDKLYVDAKIVGGVPEDNVYYIGKHGADVSTGRSIGQAFLTIQKGIDEANLQAPTNTNQYDIRINDGGSYDSFTLASKPYIQVIADGAQFQSTGSSYIIGDHNTVTFDKGIFSAGSGIFIEKQGNSDSYLNANEISDSSITTAIKVSQGTLYTNISNIDVTTANTAFVVDTNAEFFFDGQEVIGKTDIDVSGSATITVHKLSGDITVGQDGLLNLLINGSFTGNITAGDNSIVKIFLAARGAYIDNISQSAQVDIDYIGHRLDQHRNFLIGSDYAINPRQEIQSGLHPDVENDSYIADNTIYLGDGDYLVDITKGENDNLAFKVDLINKQFGILIPVENNDSLEVIGNKASISLRAAWTSGSAHNLRMALLSWDGTENNITTDVVSSWGLTPTLVSNWTYENTAENLVFSALDEYKTFKIEDIPVDTVNTKNIAVFVWIATTTTSIGDKLEISNVRGNKGTLVEDISLRPFTEELLLCKRFYDKSYDLETIAGTPTYIGSLATDKDNFDFVHGFLGANIRYRTAMLKTPIVIPYSPFSGNANKVHDERSDTDITAPASYIGTEGCQLILDPVPIEGVLITYHWVADARF